MSSGSTNKANPYGYGELQKKLKGSGNSYADLAENFGKPKENESRPLPDVIPWLLPLLHEYAGKLNALAERVAVVKNEVFQAGGFRDHWLIESARLISLHDSLLSDVERLASYGSGLVEHAPLDYEAKRELTLRTNELEEHLRFSKLVIVQLVEEIGRDRKALDAVRKLIEKSGRYKSPV